MVAGGLGYRDPAYVAAMARGLRPLPLGASGGWLVERPVAASGLMDAMAPYPFLVCGDWQKLRGDIAAINRPLVTLTAVTDPLAGVSEAQLRLGFADVVRPYKAHFVIDLTRDPESFADPHHVGCARRALKKVSVERCAVPADHLAEWLPLYDNLVLRHAIGEAARISRQSFERQLRLPDITLFRATLAGTAAGMIMCMVQGENAYFHLGAYSDPGYRSKASYALVWSIIAHFTAQGFKTLSIGAGAGTHGDASDGLTAFKRGWASGTRMAYLCGAVLDPPAYAKLTAAVPGSANFFPAYRAADAT